MTPDELKAIAERCDRIEIDAGGRTRTQYSFDVRALLAHIREQQAALANWESVAKTAMDEVERLRKHIRELYISEFNEVPEEWQ